MNTELYENKIYHDGISASPAEDIPSGSIDADVLANQFPPDSIIHAFLDDDEIQEISVTSATNTRTYRKKLKKKENK
jgi:hypothetical protein